MSFNELWKYSKHSIIFFCKTLFIIFLIPILLIIPLAFILYSLQQSYLNLFYFGLGFIGLWYLYKSWTIWKDFEKIS